MIRHLTRIGEAAVDMLGAAADSLVPRVCPVCKSPLRPHPEPVCMQCMLRLPLNHLSGAELFDARGMYFNAVRPVSMAEAWMVYDPESEYASLIREMKYNDRPSLGYYLGHHFGGELRRRGGSIGMAFEDIDVFLPMPMTWWKRLRRGYNQAEYIARGLSSVSGAAVGDNLRAIRGHRTQTRLSARRRAENLRGCFELEYGEELRGLNVAIVDDIITTGATVAEALKALSTGAPDVESISVLALAKTARR